MSLEASAGHLSLALTSAPGACALVFGVLAGGTSQYFGDRSGSRWRAAVTVGQSIAAVCVVAFAWPANMRSVLACIMCAIRAIWRAVFGEVL